MSIPSFSDYPLDLDDLEYIWDSDYPYDEEVEASGS